LAAVPKDSPKEINDQIKESIETIQIEIQRPAPRKSMIKTILAGLGWVVRTAEFTAALSALVHFFSG
jgi:hypothetical protein